MTEQEVRLQLAEVAGTWVAALAVVVGGLFGIYQYLEHKSAVRVDRSMAFVERYHSTSMLVEARLKITEAMESRTAQLNQILQNSTLDGEALQGQYESQVLLFIKEDELGGALEHLFTFYEQIILCREMDLCEDDVAGQFFDTDAEGFINTYYPYICSLRKQWHNPLQYKKVADFYIPNLDC